MALFALFVLLQVMENSKHSCPSSFISLISFPPQFPHPSTPLKHISPPSFFPPLFPSFLPPTFIFSRLLFSFLLPYPPSFLVFFSFFFPSFMFFVFCACKYFRIYVRAYLATPCVSANDNVKHVKLNIRYVFDKKIDKIK